MAIALKYSELQKANVQQQLQQTQKMEVIANLAGGVAHDLNNILAGLVSYPDMLLMDIPKKSPLRPAILTIKKSGEKASTIVQDLLTLARRGVSVREAMNLNEIVTDYLQSPEHDRLLTYHPFINVKTYFEDDLFNMMGSPVHISKSIMNLVSNAAEAMPNGGSIIISTQNQYIERPIQNDYDVKEGEYIVLKISDSGVGISPEDIKRIFEPFYTKKSMGRSGTGLGMAVVWGTVKDHNGFIKVESIEASGTKFKLYFPATRNEVKDKTTTPIDTLVGNRESILVVDDVKEQRDIAIKMLDKLNYSARAVSSGEEAIEYVKETPVDLLILDMIMVPGIDGYDSYKQITEISPGQKAIIASGYAENDRVKETQKLGAGEFIKKPYIIEKIGIAVKEALSK